MTILHAWTLGRMLLAVALAATVIVYLPGLSGPFLFDDHPNLLSNPLMYLGALEWNAVRDAALSNESGLFRRPIAALSFALNYYFAGSFDPFPFKLTNLIFHLLNGILVFLLAKRLMGRFLGDETGNGKRLYIMSAGIAGLWLLHPLQLTSVLYVVQRMNSLSALFVLGGLLLFVIGRTRLERGEKGAMTLMVGGIAGGGVLGVLCKENAALIPFYAFVIELCCFSRVVLGASSRRHLRLFYWTVLGVPFVLALAYAASHPAFILEGYQWRTFTLRERVLTQPRVLFFYLGLILFPSRHNLGLFHDDFAVSEGLLAPATTLLAIGGWIALAVLAFALRRRMPVLGFAVAWYLAGHLMESTILPLEMVFEHRNYLPILGPIAALVFALVRGMEQVLGNRRVMYATLGLLVLTLGFVTHSRSYSWSDTGILLESLLRHHPNAARTHGYYAEVLINSRGDAAKAFYHLQRYSQLAPSTINGLAEMLRIVKGVEPVDPPADMSVAATDDVSLFETRLSDRPAVLDQLERLLHQEIERRLEVYPVSASTVKTLEDLQHCLYEGASVCVGLAPTLERWSELALDNPRTESKHQAILLLASAKIQTWRGNISRGLAYAELAASTAPGIVHFQIQLAKLHLELGNYESGLAVVERIRARGSLLGFRMQEVADLEARLRAGALQRVGS